MMLLENVQNVLIVLFSLVEVVIQLATYVQHGMTTLLLVPPVIMDTAFQMVFAHEKANCFYDYSIYLVF